MKCFKLDYVLFCNSIFRTMNVEHSSTVLANIHISAVMECPVLSATVVTSHMWTLMTRNVAGVTEELGVLFSLILINI